MRHRGNLPIEQTRVVFLVNFLSPNLIEVFREVQRRVGSLHVLASVPTEANRPWAPDYADLTVVEQRTWTSRRSAKHPGGYVEELFVHFPVDTLSQLKRLRPHCVVSLEMGMRSVMANLYRQVWRRDCRHVLAVYGSERSEAGRGKFRRWLRARLISAADTITYNGPSCRRYLLSMGAPESRLVPWYYAADPRKAYRGPIQPSPTATESLRLLTVSQLIARKGTLGLAQQLSAWASQNSHRSLIWSIAGTGPELSDLQQVSCPPNLHREFLGHCDTETLRNLYRDNPVLVFPTLGDEWGLVVDEGLASGQVIVGSIHSQAVTTLVQVDQTGWHYNPEVLDLEGPTPSALGSLAQALDQLAAKQPNQLDAMRRAARSSVAQRTHVESAEQFISAVAHSLT